MYDNNFSGVNNSGVENNGYNPEVKPTVEPAEGVLASQSSAETNAGVYGNNSNNSDASVGNSYSSNTSAGSYSSNNATDSSAYSGSSYGNINNTGVGSYSSNTSTDSSSYSSSSYGNGSNASVSSYSSNSSTDSGLYSSSAYGNSSNTSVGSYGNNSNVGSGSYSSSNNNSTAGSAYSNSYAGNSNVRAGSYSSGNSASANNYNNTGSYGYATGTWNNPNNRQTDNSYQFSNNYSDYTAAAKKEKKKKEKKQREKTGSGYFKKVLICVSLGLFFGVCAGLGFYAVETATGMFDNVSTVNTTGNAAGESASSDTDGTNEVISESVSYDINGSDIQKTQTVTTVVSDVSDVVDAVMPAVVSISNTYTERMSYFGQVMTSEAEASGSGIIVGKNDTELLIATNYHVIADADLLKVQFVENSEVEASVKGMDADMDLAVIAVSLDNIKESTLSQIAIATLGDSDALKVGEPAIAIGNSLGYGQSVTTGVVSALNRDMELSDGSTGTFIQTDAAINPGNSGGALLNIKGEVIGINSNKIGGSVIEGMGYAIPISAASPIIAELMLKETKNKVAEDERGFLGISGISVTSEVSSAYGMPEGVYIAQVYEGTAADAAGLVKGDIITEFDGEKVSSMDELQTILEYYAKGDTVEMTVMTIGNGGYQSKTVSITLGNKVG
ncbi:MAG: PDZ domain-containing protein [Lachnospiraceae bacterium]|nr:PDZ domain-containing protein [Lachnospiraceae bacterium]